MSANTTTATAVPEDTIEQRVLVLAPYGRDAAEVCRVLGQAGIGAEPCPDVDALCGAVREGAAAALVAEEALAGGAVDQLGAALAEQPPWSDFPLLLMISRSRDQGDGWQLLRNLENFAYLRLLERPLRTASLVSAVRTAVRSRWRQYQVRDELAARQRAEQALGRQRELLQGIVDNIPVMLVIWDANLRRFTLNRHVEEVLGWTTADAAEGDFMAKACPDPQCRAAVVHHMQSLTPGWLEQELAAKDGSRVPTEWANIRLTDDTRIGIGLDLRERKRAEKKLKQLNETLEAQVAERTAVAERRAGDLSRLAAELSEAEHRERRRLAKLLHDDLQQLLLAVKLRLPVLVECEAGQREPHVQKLDALLGECMSTSRNLTQELSPPVIEYGSLAEVLGWLGGWFGEQHGLEVGLQIGGDLPPAPEHLRVFLFDAVRELLFNVVKHSGRLEARVALSFQRGHFVTQVEDRGDGFDPEAVEARLRQPEGFGLFNIRERLEALGGMLEIHNGAGGGACFRMFVPASEEAEPEEARETARHAAARARPPHVRRGSIRVLVVDDHEVVREGMVGLLERLGDIEVVGEAANGREGVEQAEALRPDAVIMDVDMPGMNGVEATREIKHRRPETVVVGLSLHEEAGVRRAMAEAGADGYISKHAPAKDLVAAIRHLCTNGSTTTAS